MTPKQEGRLGAERRSRGPSRLVRAAVVEATIAELSDGGYAAVSLERVARRAGVAKTTLYRRWGTKEGLVLEAMLERAGTRVSVPDTGSLRADLLEFAETVATNAATPEVSAMARAVVAGAPHDSTLAAAARDFWAQRLALDAVIVSRGVDRGEAAADTDPQRVIESVIGPIHLRLLLTGEPVDGDFLEGVVDTVIDGIASET
ncbi:TetR/AcrR family transcriptional regulator [Mumia sp. Pv 4-285]|uniref:TetR/AcrR family transcriptional regulator n=1 Tax=Mumia qirimensis TaxID=3234852 RepID=UPI00351D1F50